jgi:hypothetical protein
MGATNDRRSRTGRRAFRPELGGAGQPLEPRVLLSEVKAVVTGLPRVLAQQKATPVRVSTTASRASGGQLQANATSSAFIHTPRILTMRGGKGVRIQDGNGSAFNVILDTGPGTVRGKINADGTFDIRVLGTNANSELVVNPVRPVGKIGLAHSFDPTLGVSGEVLELGDVEVVTGKIGAILGYRTANLNGSLVLNNDSPINRIALNRLRPGALIQTTGDLNSLNVFTDADLSGEGTGIVVGRDLNWFSVGGNLTLNDGATLHTNRDIGLIAQGAKDSDPGGQGLVVQGNLDIGATGSWTVGRNVSGRVLIQGNFSGADRFIVTGSIQGSFIVLGSLTG